ncbi:hypothetical protein QEO92_29305 (plasmid) [Neorhizobium petrolearium]|uniref:Uncharacterized protein n=1 Tax=Neorhizobium petrolearium TaxID=515361 RepID=A0ABY8MAH7_9HYPH|nr:hypothetical protein [Neorhizobium petrolearium]WGI71437.1 hypothetical protein QEO92_29305 [Neorhizobium petrolearium]
MQMEGFLLAFGPRDEKLALIESGKQLSRLGRSGDCVRQGGRDFRQQVKREQHLLLGRRKRVKEMSAKSSEDRRLSFENVVNTASIGQEHKPDGPSSSTADIDLRGSLFQPEFD